MIKPKKRKEERNMGEGSKEDRQIREKERYAKRRKK